MLKLVERNEGKEKVLKEGNLKEIVNYLKENEDLIEWIWTDHDNIHELDIEKPSLDDIETAVDLRRELEKVDLDWWTLEVEEM